MDNAGSIETSTEASKKDPFRVLTILYCVFFIAYCTLRAWYVAFTHDEAYTVAKYMHDDLKNVMLYIHSDPNNHMMNTVLGRLFSKLFGENWFVFRLPSVLSLGILIFTLFRIFLKEIRPVVMLSGFILLTFNPFLIDFFSLARGYSGAFACMGGALYYARLYLKSDFLNGKYPVYATILAGVTVLFHLSMLNFFVPFTLTLLICPWLQSVKEKGFRLSKETLKKLIISSIVPILIFVAFLLFIMPVALRFKHQGEFDFAGPRGFWQNSINSVIEESFYWQRYPDLASINNGILIFIWTIIGGAILLIGLPFTIKKGNKAGLAEFLFLLIIAVVCFMVLQHYLIGNPYPVNRFMLFLYLLFMILAVFVLNRIVQLGNIFIIVPLVFTVFAGLHMAKTLNLDHTKMWAFDADNPVMLHDLKEICKNDLLVKKPIDLGISWLFAPSVNYYRRYGKQEWLQEVNKNTLNKRQKYLYLLNDDIPLLKGWHLKKLKEYPVADASLFLNLNLDSSKPVYTQYFENNDLNNPNVKFEINPKNIPLNDSLILQIELKASLERINEMAGLALDWVEKGNTYTVDERPGTNTIEAGKVQTYYISFKLPPLKNPNSKLAIRTYVDGNAKSIFYSINTSFYILIK